MFSCARSSHGEGPESHPSVDVLALLVLGDVVRLEQQHRVEVAVPDVAKQRSWKVEELNGFNKLF